MYVAVGAANHIFDYFLGGIGLLSDFTELLGKPENQEN
jgi:hypothetical protein